MRSFVNIKLAQNGKITLSFTDVGNSCSSRKSFNVANIFLNAIRENKIIAKNSGFTVLRTQTPIQYLAAVV